MFELAPLFILRKWLRTRKTSNAVLQVGFDTDRDFMLVEIAGDELYFQAISRTGTTIDSGALSQQVPVKTK